MSSWRDAASEEVREDFDRLVDALLPQAVRQLERRGRFLPYAACLDGRGGIRLIAGYGAAEQPTSAAIVRLLKALRADSECLRAFALVSDVELGGFDSVRVELEHRDGPAIAVLRPYRRTGRGEPSNFGDLTAIPAQRQVWKS